MSEVRRSGGVTAAAIIGLIGSVGAGGVAVLMALGAAVMNSPATREQLARQPAPSPVSPMAVALVMSAVALACAAWGVASAIGLWNQKNWGRISFLVAGGIAVAMGLMNVAGGVLMIALFSVMTFPDPAPPRGILVGTAIVTIIVSLAISSIGIWWLVMLNRKDVKAQFGEVAATRPEWALPMRVLVVAWLLVLSILALPIVLAMRAPLPAFFFGMELHGWVAALLLVGQLAVAVIAGVGLLRRRREALALSVGFYVFALINFAAMTLMPGGLSRVLRAYQPLTPDAAASMQLIDSLTPMMIVATITFNVAVLALLMSARGAYFRACAAPRALPAG